MSTFFVPSFAHTFVSQHFAHKFINYQLEKRFENDKPREEKRKQAMKSVQPIFLIELKFYRRKYHGRAENRVHGCQGFRK